jgi:hypothetical protein
MNATDAAFNEEALCERRCTQGKAREQARGRRRQRNDWPFANLGIFSRCILCSQLSGKFDADDAAANDKHTAHRAPRTP